MPLADMFQLTHRYTAFGKQMHNVYHCERVNATIFSPNISDAFATSVLPAIRLLQTLAYLNNTLEIFNLEDPEDFHTGVLGGFGDRAGTENQPSFVAGGVRFPSKNRDVHAGQKRFPGLLETDILNGVLSGAVITLIDDIADDLLATWLSSGPANPIANFCIIKRVCEETDPVTGKCLKYRLPESDGELVFYIPTTHVVNPEVTSQVSRKVTA